jgi:electron transfer flavoprotein alpha subunit
VDALAALVEQTGADTVLFAASVLAADVAAGLAARLDAGLNWDVTDLALQDGELTAKRPALGDTVLVDVGWTGTPRLALVRSGTFDAPEASGAADVEPFTAQFEEFSTLAELVGHDQGRPPAPRSRRPT